MEENRIIFPCTSSDYVIELMNKNNNNRNKDEIVDMLIKNFLHDETLIKSLLLNEHSKNTEEETNLLLDERLMMSTVIDAGIILLAIHKETNRISGVLIIIIHDREKERIDDNDKKSKPYEGKLKSKVIKDFYKYIEIIESHIKGDDKLYKNYPNYKIYADFELIGVNKLDRKKGIALDLYEAALNLIKNTIPQVSLITGTYTSIYSKKIAKKIGKTTISKFDVMQLRDDDGNPIFQDTEPHNIVSLMAMEI